MNALKADAGKTGKGDASPCVAVFGGNNCSGPIDVAPALNAHPGGGRRMDFASEAFCVTGSVTHALRAEGADASEDGTGRGTPIIAFPSELSGTQAASVEGLSPALSVKHTMSLVRHAAVRRLTPTECERLMSFPDGWTAIPWRGKPASECPDGNRYKALGNSKVVSVVRWIGKRIQAHAEALPPELTP